MGALSLRLHTALVRARLRDVVGSLGPSSAGIAADVGCRRRRQAARVGWLT